MGGGYLILGPFSRGYSTYAVQSVFCANLSGSSSLNSLEEPIPLKCSLEGVSYIIHSTKFSHCSHLLRAAPTSSQGTQVKRVHL